jgi:hypothetical protein
MTSLLLLMLWDGPKMWTADASSMQPGGGGIIATGGATDYYLTCANCHIRSDPSRYGLIDLQLTFAPALMSVGGAEAYQPLQTYTVTVNMIGEHLGMSGCDPTAKNVNNFAATFEDGNGQRVGLLQSDSGQSSASCPMTIPDGAPLNTTVMMGDCHAIWASGNENLTQWTFMWTAPAAGSGPITAYYAGVDGNCKMNSLDDDVKVGKRVLMEGMAAARRKNRVWFALGALLPVAWLVWRRRLR